MKIIPVKISKVSRFLGLFFCAMAIFALVRILRSLVVSDVRVESLSPAYLIFLLIGIPFFLVLIGYPSLLGGYPESVCRILPKKLLLYFGLSFSEFESRLKKGIIHGDSTADFFNDLEKKHED